MALLPDRNLSRAVLIGASTFEHLSDLPGVRNNLVDLRKVLTDPEHGVIAPENCQVVDEPASPLVFMRALRSTVSRTDDFLLVYYAGHGERLDHDDQLYLAVRETEPDGLDGSAVPFAWVKRALENRPARTTLLILDCCYSGTAVGAMSGGGVTSGEIEISGTAVLASSPKNQISHAPVGHRHTAFTGKLIQLLAYGSPNEGEPLTVQSLYQRLQVALASERLPEPKLVGTDSIGSLLLRRTSAVRPLPQPPRAPSLEPLTIPHFRPVAARPPVVPPVPLVVPQAPSKMVPVPSPVLMRLVKKTGRSNAALLRILWGIAGSALATTVGGILGVIVGAPQADGSPAKDGSFVASGLVIMALCGAAIWWFHRHWPELHRDISDPRLARSVVGLAVLAAGVVLFVALMVDAAVGGRTSGATGGASEVNFRTSFAFVLSECAVACGYLLSRGIRRRRR